MPPSVIATFEYDGDETIVATLYGAEIGHQYTLCALDSNSDCPTETADADPFVMTTTGIGGVGNPVGSTCAVVVADDNWGVGDPYIACATFRIGTPGLYELDVDWNFDGIDTVSATFLGPSGFQVDGEDEPAFVSTFIDPVISDIYVSFDVRFVDGTLSAQVGNGYTSTFFTLMDADHDVEFGVTPDGLYLLLSAGDWKWATLQQGIPFGVGTVAEGDTWYHVDMRYRFVAGVGYTTVKIDGVDFGESSSGSNVSTVGGVLFGLGFASENGQSLYQYDNITIGTSAYGSTEIADVDFESGTLETLFDQVQGPATLSAAEQTYHLTIWDPVNGNSDFDTGTSGASPLTLEIQADITPVEGDYFAAVLQPFPGAFLYSAIRLFQEGVAGSGTDGSVAAPSTQEVGGQRFFQGYEWRFLITDFDSVTTLWAERLATGRRIVRSLNAPTVIEGAIWPDDRRVNDLHTDGYPRVAQSNRIVYAFRREGGTALPWIVKDAGILMSPQDEGDEDQPLTHFTAYDPWKLLEGRPCMNADGSLPDDSEGIQWLDTQGSIIAVTLLKNTIDNEGFCHIDAGELWGGTEFYEGTIGVTGAISFTAGYGESVAEAWTRLTETGLDIVLTAIYDPINRPGYTHELSIYALAGDEKPSAVFGWGMMNRAVTKIDRMHDGTPGSFFNKVQYHAGQGGPPVPLLGPLVNALSVADFGSYWSQQFFPNQTSVDETGGAVYALAAQALVMAKQGRRTMTLVPTPERAPIPLTAYDVGDRVPIYAPRTLRVTASGYQRVLAIPIELDDDGIESISALLCSPDFREE